MGSSYWLTRVVFLRCLATLYAVAFLVALNQNGPLIGDNGLTPASLFIKSNKQSGSPLELIASHPTIFWVIPPTSSNLSICAYVGLLGSVLVILKGSANLPLLFVLWAAYFSIVNVGQTWYSFGWESQLLETGFLAMFMVPVFSLDRYPQWTPTPTVCLWGYRWLLFRIMIGAGMIKIRGDQCWRDLTCMNYHYQTQPNPNPISIYFHNNYEIIHMIETLGNHFVELVCPFLLLVPLRLPSIVGGVIQIVFQGILISSGNLAFLNWLTAVPAVACFDDQSLSVLFSVDEQKKADKAELNYQRELYLSASGNRFFTVTPSVAEVLYSHKKNDKEKDDEEDDSNPSVATAPLTVIQSVVNHILLHGGMYRPNWASGCILTRRVTGLLLTLVLAYLSQPVVMNILSPRQAMNVNFEPFRIVNSYGAFGSITKVRHEVVVQGTNATSLTASTQWYDFEFPCKPGDINRIPCLISPYHLRMDWLMWFAAFQNYQHCPWLVHFVDKLLRGEEEVTKLLSPSGNPFDPHRHEHRDLGVVFGAVSSVFGGGEGGECCKGHKHFDEGTASAAIEEHSSYSPPTFVRAELYEYQYAPLTEDQRKKDLAAGWEVGRWWKRKHAGSYLPALDKGNESVKKFLQGNSMIE